MRYFRRDGTEITRDQWLQHGGAADDWNSIHNVSHTRVGNHWVATIWHGCDTTGHDPPAVYETSVLAINPESDKTCPFADYEVPYTSEERAREGHEEMVRIIMRHDRLLDADRAAASAPDHPF